MNEQVIRTIEFELISRKETYYCVTCGGTEESTTFVLVEKQTRAIVTYMGITNENYFICTFCRRKK